MPLRKSPLRVVMLAVKPVGVGVRLRSLISAGGDG